MLSILLVPAPLNLAGYALYVRISDCDIRDFIY